VSSNATQNPISSEVHALSDEIVETMASFQPVSATFKGVPGHDAEWDDWSPAGVAKITAALTGFKARIRALPPQEGRWSRLAARVMEDFVDLELDALDQADPLNDLNSMASPLQLMRMVFDSMDTSSRQGWENIAERLDRIDDAAEGYILKLESHRAFKELAAARQVRAAIDQAMAQAGDTSFFRSLAGSMRAKGFDDSALVARVQRGGAKACAVFGSLAEYLEQVYLPEAPVEDAVGRERYLRHARRFLGMELDADETYAWGWSEVRSIQASIRRLADEILPGAPLAEVFRLLKTDPSRCAKDPEEFLRLMAERQARALKELEGSHFEIPDELRKLDIRIAPKGGPLGAYYVMPSEDFNRPGSIFYSLGDEGPIPLYDEISTAYHEGFPGHHLQVGLQVSLIDRLCRFHRLSEGYHGYAEGWALYAERLMHELGYFEKPDYVLGMLCAQMVRACRIVIDIGAHLDLPIPSDSPFHPGERWSFDLGVEMLRDWAELQPDHAVSEMNRYLGWPGQAISYKVGERVILGLREEERARLGSAFNLREFHAKVVGSGPVALQILREIIRDDATA
jgi:uncharacterized protein (DUF885 family)